MARRRGKQAQGRRRSKDPPNPSHGDRSDAPHSCEEEKLEAHRVKMIENTPPTGSSYKTQTGPSDSYFL